MADKHNSESNTDTHASVIGRNILTFLIVLGILFFVWLLAKTWSIVILVLISVVLATGLGPAVAWLERVKLPRNKRIPRAIAILLIYIFTFIIVLSATALIVVPAVRETIQFSKQLPYYINHIDDTFNHLRHRFTWLPEYSKVVNKAREQLGAAGQYVLGSMGAAFGFLGSLVSMFTVAIITFYLLLTYESIRDGFLSLLPRSRREHTNTVLKSLSATMGGWLRGQLILAGVIGLIIALAMLLIGVPYPFVIAVVGATGEMIPMVGPFAAAIPAIMVTAFGPPWRLAASIIFFLILVFVESNILAPKIMQKQVGLSPIITIMALLIGATLLGVVGALLAVPLAAAIQVFVVMVVFPAIRKWSEEKDKS